MEVLRLGVVVLLLLGDAFQVRADEPEKGILCQVGQLLFLNGQPLWGKDLCEAKCVCCDGKDYFGVGCSNGRVTRLTLSSAQLKGQLSPLLSNLTELSSINFSCNQITGPIPPFNNIFKLTAVYASLKVAVF